MNPKAYDNSPNLPMGAFNAMISKTVSSGQEHGLLKLESELFVAGRVGLENYKSILKMLDEFKKDPTNGKKTVMVFPGVTKVFKSIQQANEFLQEPLECSDKLIPVIFKFQGTAMDVSKFLADDAASSLPGLPDGLMQRLTGQVQGYSIEGEDTEATIKKVRGPGGHPGIHQMIHCFELKQLKAPNDPNTADSSNSAPTTWAALLK